MSGDGSVPVHVEARQVMMVAQLFYSVAAMNALFASAAWCAASPSRPAIAAVLLFAGIWPFSNGVLEGDVLLTLDEAHGITVSDVLSVGAVVLAIVQAARLARRRRQGR